MRESRRDNNNIPSSINVPTQNNNDTLTEINKSPSSPSGAKISSQPRALTGSRPDLVIVPTRPSSSGKQSEFKQVDHISTTICMFVYFIIILLLLFIIIYYFIIILLFYQCCCTDKTIK